MEQRKGVHMKRVSMILTVLLLALLPIIAQAQDEQITLQLKWKHQFQFAGFYMALEKGYYRDAGLDLQLIEGGPGKSSAEHVVSNDAAYGVTSTGALVERSQGKPVKAIGAIFQHSPLVLLVNEASMIKSWADLRGKRVMLQNGYQNAGILAALQAAGIGETEITRQDISYQIHDLIAGNTDAYAGYATDQPHQMQLLGAPYRILNPVDQGVDFYGDIVITSDAEISQHPERARAFMQATARGWNDALEHIDAAIDLILLKYNSQHLPREQLLFEARETKKLIMQDVVNIGYMNDYRWQRIARTYEDQGLLAANYSLSEFLYQPEPTLTEVIRQNIWWLLLFAGLLLFFMLGLHIALLRRTVRQRTQTLEDAHAALLSTETKFRKIFENALDPLLLMRPDHDVIVDVNPAASAMLGYSHDELINMPVSVIHPGEMAELKSFADTVFKEGRGSADTLHCLTRDGECKEVEMSAARIETDGETGMIVSVHDISDRRKQERFDNDQLHIMQQIADSAVPLADVLEAIVVAVQRLEPAMLGSILLLDKQGKYLQHGAAPDLPAAYCSAIDGVEIGPFVGSCGTAAFTGERVIVADIASDPLWADYKQFALEYGLAACWSQPVKSADGVVLGTFAMYYRQPRSPNTRDLRLIEQAAALAANAINRRRIEESRIEMQAQVEHMHRLESLGVLAGGIAHDFNNILTAILGNAAMAERKALSNPMDTRKYLSNIVGSSERAAELCKQMLAYSGKGKFVVRAINLSAMVEEITKLLEISINKGVVLKYHLTADLPAVEADAAQMQQVIMNLVINASDAIADKSGVISIATGMMQADSTYLSSTSLDDQLPAGRYIYLEVSDTGCGMDKQTQAKLFEPFFTTKFTGHGLGMSAVLGIVRGHHGAIRVYSEPGQGTTFKVLLPASDALAEPVDQGRAFDQGWHGDGTVLIVDDEETIRETAAMMLEEMGFATLTATDGVDGVSVYREHQSEIVAVLLDMTMPKMDGKTCFTELRRINPDVRVILSSGYNEQEATSRFAGQGLAGFIQKPYFPDALQALMQETGDDRA